MADKFYRPRLSIEISEQQAKALQDLVPWGLKNQLFCVIVDDIIRLAASHGQQFLAAVLASAIHLEDYSTAMAELKKEDC